MHEYSVVPLGDGVLVAGAVPEQAGDGYSWFRVDTSGHAPRQLDLSAIMLILPLTQPLPSREELLLSVAQAGIRMC